MGFRFRRSVRLFPGVRLNFSASGVSTSIGIRGASVTVSPRGSHLNLGIPGTGISYRESLSKGLRAVPPAEVSFFQPSAEPNLESLAEAPPDSAEVLEGEIKSAGNDAVTSLDLKEFRDLLADAYKEYRRLRQVMPECISQVETTCARAQKWTDGFFLKRLLRKKYERLLREHEQAKSEQEALHAEIEKCRIALEIDMEASIGDTYDSLVEAFRGLAACECCWDTTSAVPINKVLERSSADQSITRTRVQLDLEAADVLAPSLPAPHFQNANGGDLYLLPGFLLVYGTHADFALVRLPEVLLEFKLTGLLETEEVPSDAKKVGETWAKVNKDGTPDRRFASNYRIPILEYGQITFTSASGLNEQFLFSDGGKAKAFADAFALHRTRFQPQAGC